VILCLFAQLAIVFKKEGVADVAVLHILKVWLTYGVCNGLKTGWADRIDCTVIVSTMGEYGTSRPRSVHRLWLHLGKTSVTLEGERVKALKGNRLRGLFCYLKSNFACQAHCRR
jgi:hypothetical protein